MNIDSSNISDARNQLHWASQLLSAAADAKLEKAADDSHSNLGWNQKSRQLFGRANCAIAVDTFQLLTGAESYSLSGQTLESARAWLSIKINSDLVMRDYEMPAHPLAEGAVFSPAPSQLASIGDWFTFAESALAGNGPLRVWPHHFDMGFWSVSDVQGKSIGGGFSLGDGNYNQPYFYMNLYGIERPDVLPELAVGHWTEHWFGAVLTAEELVDAGQNQAATTAKRFVADAHDQLQSLIA